MKKRVVVHMEEEVDKYCTDQAEKLGISKSGFINVMIAQYRQYNEMINQVPLMLQQIQLIDKNNKDK